VLRRVLPLAVLAAACAPQTDLASSGGAGGTAGLGAGARLVDPAAGATGVPRNLAAVWLAFAGPVSVPGGALRLGGAGGLVPVGDPAVGDCPDGSPGLCVKMAVQGALESAQTYVVSLAPGVERLDGSAIAPGEVGQFDTAVNDDRIAPSILGLAVTPSGPCALVAFQTDEPAEASVHVDGDGVARVVAAGAGASQFAVAIPLGDLPAAAAVSLSVVAVDRAGNQSTSAAIPLTIPDGLLPLAITEVHANPAGPEPAQEFVEVRNLGAEPVSVGGLAIADAKGMDALPELLLAAGAYALIVPSGFDAASAKDTPPLAGTPLLRVDSRIGSDGLSNGGEAIRLLSPGGGVISSYGAAVDVSATAWAGQSVHRVPETACDQAASWTQRPLPATPGWAAP